LVSSQKINRGLFLPAAIALADIEPEWCELPLAEAM
jgi:hypothetical protein